MTFYKYTGKCIRASDKPLVYRFCGGSLLLLFVATILLLNMGQICTDWDKFTLISNDRLTFTLSTYNFTTIIVTTGSCLLVTFLYYRFYHDKLKQLIHHQKLARMVLDNV